jgi:hypothetical protein
MPQRRCAGGISFSDADYRRMAETIVRVRASEITPDLPRGTGWSRG